MTNDERINQLEDRIDRLVTTINENNKVLRVKHAEVEELKNKVLALERRLAPGSGVFDEFFKNAAAGGATTR